ncbi:MAG TPA: Na/Pi symporter [Gammaproteobacteria bacterium]
MNPGFLTRRQGSAATMYRKILLPTIFVILAWGFWASPDFKVISAGVAIFLFGMVSLEEGFKSFTGGVLEQLLRRTTDKVWKSLAFGIVSTTLMQSSSLVSVITISFLSAGLLELAAGIGIIFGANLGTTTGAWLVAGFGLKVNIAAYAMPMLVFGVILVFQRPKALKGVGYILAGVGFLFLGIAYMKDGFDAFKATIDLSRFAIPGLLGLLIYTLIGIVATVIMQSSHATLVLTITALSAGQLTYENALALAIGANVGTTITAILGALSANEQGRRLAGAHLVFNLITGLIAIVFIKVFAWSVNGISDLVGIAPDDYTLKLAVFHTLFNLVGVGVMLPQLGRLVTTLERVIRPREFTEAQPRYLNSASMEFPDTAVQAVRQETLHIWELARDIIAGGLRLKPEQVLGSADLEQLVQRPVRGEALDIELEYDTKVKPLYNAVIAFISRAAFGWEEKQSADLHWLREANRHIVEAIKGIKHLQKNLEHYVRAGNPHIRGEYNRLRAQIAQVMRALELCHQPDQADVAILGLDHLRAELDQSEGHFSDRLYALIREQRITPPMGTSLMNDTGYAYEIQRNLIAMATTLFSGSERDLDRTQRKLALDETELAALATAEPAPSPTSPTQPSQDGAAR